VPHMRLIREERILITEAEVNTNAPKWGMLSKEAWCVVCFR